MASNRKRVDLTDMAIEDTVAIAIVIGIIALVAVIAYVRFFPASESAGGTTTAWTTISGTTYTSSIPEHVTAPTSSSSSASTTTLAPNTVLLNVQLSNSYGQPVISPSVIRVKVWSNVVLNVTNEGNSTHGLWIQFWSGALGTPYLRPGQSFTLAFTPNQVGNFSYYSQVGNDQKNGMAGTLVVTGS